jgi:hypothetical protein
MNLRQVLVCFSLIWAAGLKAQQQELPATLPIKRVVLFKNGVGYFEHLGRVRGNQEVTVGFTSGQLNDVLKSFTVLDLNGGRIGRVGYSSSAPAARQLGDLQLPVGERSSLTEFLTALRGARIEIKSGTTVASGRLLSVERKTRTGGGTTLEVDYVALVSDNGEIRTAEVSPSFSVRLLDEGLPQKVNRYLDIVSLQRQSDERQMNITTSGEGERQLFVSYISEVPVWKATYRLVLDSKAGGKPLLQGWAVVDNTVGQDWEKVDLSLVAGAPQSFIQKLSQPYYSRRPEVPLHESLTSTPQTYEATLRAGGGRIAGVIADPIGASVAGAAIKVYDDSGALMAQTQSNAWGRYEVAALSEGAYRVEAQMPGFRTSQARGVAVRSNGETVQDLTLHVGGVSETVEVRAQTPELQTSTSSMAGSRSAGSGRTLGGQGQVSLKAAPPPPPPPPMMAARVQDARLAAMAQAAGQELGDLFEYKLKEPVTIRKNSSALVPIVQSEIAAEKLSVWNETQGMRRPQRALWLENTTKHTLEGGSFSVIESETFAGEGIFDLIRSGEKRLVSYASDLALNASSRSERQDQRITRVRIVKGLMIHEREVRQIRTYTFRNEDDKPRTVIVEHPVQAGFELRGAAKPFEVTSSWQRFRVEVGPRKPETLKVEEAQPAWANYQVKNLTSDQIGVFVSQKSISPAITAMLRKVVEQRGVVSEWETRASNLDEERDNIYDDQQRLRENIKSLKGSAEEKALLQRYTQELNRQEDRLQALKREIEDAGNKRDAAQEELDRMVAELAFDVAL